MPSRNVSITDINGNIGIGKAAFLNEPGITRRTIAHEMGHYKFDRNWDDGKVGGTISDPKITNSTSIYRNDGLSGYNNSIREAGKYHIAPKYLKKNIFINNGYKFDFKYLKDSWRNYGIKKWIYVLPKRF